GIDQRGRARADAADVWIDAAHTDAVGRRAVGHVRWQVDQPGQDVAVVAPPVDDAGCVAGGNVRLDGSDLAARDADIPRPIQTLSWIEDVASLDDYIKRHKLHLSPTP